MLAVIVYSCFTSAYYTAFEFPYQTPALVNIEHFIFACFTADILLNFVRIQNDKDGTQIRSHIKLLQNQFNSVGKVINFCVEIIASFPFYLLGGAENFVVFKLLRMLKMSRIWKLLDIERFKKIAGVITSRATRNTKIRA